MGCNCGFGGSPSGGGGGSGNLSGDLTATRVPVATGLHALVDSMISIEAGIRALFDGTIKLHSDISQPVQLERAGGTGYPIEWLTSLGTLVAPEMVAEGAILGMFDFRGMDDDLNYQGAVQIRYPVGGPVSPGVVPGRIEIDVADLAGNLQTVLVHDVDGGTEVKGQLRVEKSTKQTQVELAVSDGVAEVDALASNWFTLEVVANTELGNPLNPEAGRYFRVRTRQNGGGGFVLSFDTLYRFPGGVEPVLTLAAGAVDYLSFTYDEVDDRWDYVGGAQNFVP